MKIKNAIIFGAGQVGRLLYHRFKEKQNILFFVDNNHENISAEIEVFPASVLLEADFDVIYIASANQVSVQCIYNQLIYDLKIPAAKINKLYSEFWAPLDTSTYTTIASLAPLALAMRFKFLKEFAVYAYDHSIEGSVAEVGVFQGDFAKEINKAFYDRRLYLFDTFEGFDERDIIIEKDINPFMDFVNDHYHMKKQNSSININIVLNKLLFPENCVVKQGYFPNSFDKDIYNEKFVFVSLDPDLYQPIKEGLEIFYPLMQKNGVILVHNYFDIWLGARKAVDEFIRKYKTIALPIGDYYSIALIKS